MVLPCWIPSCAIHGIQRPGKAGARAGPSAQGEMEAYVKNGFVFANGLVPAAGHSVSDEGQWGTGVFV